MELSISIWAAVAFGIAIVVMAGLALADAYYLVENWRDKVDDKEKI